MPLQITPFTTTPSRANPATFSADMDTRLTQENSRIVEMNSQSTENNDINTNVNAKEVLATAAAATATTKAGEALGSANNASDSELAAAASAAYAETLVGALNSTSISSVLIGTGSKTFTTQTAKTYTIGQYISIVSNASSLNYMYGQVTSYDSGTGILILNVTQIGGSGTFADWKIAVTGMAFAGGNLTSALNYSKATVISHATTADIWGALGNQIDFTGTETITAFPNAPQAGAERTLICAGACSFTAGSNMLIDGVTSGNTVTCSVNDTVMVRAISTTQFKLTRLKADGTAQVSPVSGSLTLLSTITVSTPVASITSTIFSTAYDRYILEFEGLHLSTESYPRFRLATGGTDITTGYWYGITANTTSIAATNSSTLGYFVVTINSSSFHRIGGTIGFNGAIDLVGCLAGNIKKYHVQGVHESTTAGVTVNDMGNGVSADATLTAGSVSGLTFTVGDGGNFVSGIIKIYGVL